MILASHSQVPLPARTIRALGDTMHIQESRGVAFSGNHITGSRMGAFFTTYEPDGRYGNVTVRGNTFISGPNATHAMTFASGGKTILVEGNVLRGPVTTIPAPIGCEQVLMRGNQTEP